MTCTLSVTPTFVASSSMTVYFFHFIFIVLPMTGIDTLIGKVTLFSLNMQATILHQLPPLSQQLNYTFRFTDVIVCL